MRNPSVGLQHWIVPNFQRPNLSGPEVYILFGTRLECLPVHVYHDKKPDERKVSLLSPCSRLTHIDHICLLHHVVRAKGGGVGKSRLSWKILLPELPSEYVGATTYDARTRRSSLLRRLHRGRLIP